MTMPIGKEARKFAIKHANTYNEMFKSMTT